jgi:peptide-methionine (S)-S-oxide reductase
MDLETSKWSRKTMNFSRTFGLLLTGLCFFINSTQGGMSAESQPKQLQTAIFAAGCFWGVEEHFGKIKGVVATEVGYTGGKTVNPTYEKVCTGTTGHAEAVKVTFDPSVISYKQLVDDFMSISDPRLPHPFHNGQYRSAIFYTTPDQEKIALASKHDLEKPMGIPVSVPIFVDVQAAGPFYRAEEYHQKYNQKNGSGFCHLK